MATKTFEELKQMAIQIRDEKTNKQNTATRIGTQMLEHLNKLEQEYYNKENIDKQKNQTDLKLSNLQQNTGVSSYPTFSQDELYPVGQIINYDDRLYEFTVEHAPGAWDNSHVKPSSVKNDTDKKFSELAQENGVFSSKIGFPILFEYGGISGVDGSLVENKIRIRSRAVFSGAGINKIKLEYPGSLIYNTTFAFKGNVFTKVLSGNIDSDNILSFVNDGTFDNIKMTFRKADETEISVEELNATKSLFIENDSMGFEYGGISGVDGSLVGNKIRIRSLPIHIKKIGGLGLKIQKDEQLQISVVIGYKNNTFVKNIPFIINNNDNTLSFMSDGTFDNIRISLRLEDESNISVKQMNNTYVRFDESNIEFKYTLFEYGGIRGDDGSLVENKIRIRSLPINLFSYNKSVNLYMSINNKLKVVGIFAYKRGIFVQFISNFIYSDNILSFVNDGTFDNIRISLRLEDETEISDSIRNECFLISNSDIFNANIEVKKLKYAALGDSITYGFIPRNYPGYPGQLNSYAKLAAAKLGMNFVNYGISGSSIANVSGRSPMSERYVDMIDDADIITVMGGTNDVRSGVQLGTMEDRTNDTFYGALHVLYQGLYTKYIGGVDPSIGKTKKIIVLTPLKLLDGAKASLPNTIENNAIALFEWDEWINAIKEVAAFYSFPVLDFYNLSGVNPHLNRTVVGTEPGYTGNYNPYVTDGTHPTQEMHEYMSEILVGFLKH